MHTHLSFVISINLHINISLAHIYRYHAGVKSTTVSQKSLIRRFCASVPFSSCRSFVFCSIRLQSEDEGKNYRPWCPKWLFKKGVNGLYTSSYKEFATYLITMYLRPVNTLSDASPVTFPPWTERSDVFTIPPASWAIMVPA